MLMGLDQFGHVIFSPLLFYRVANEDETISSRLGKIKDAGKGIIPWKYPLARMIDWCLDKIDPNHSVDAIESDED